MWQVLDKKKLFFYTEILTQTFLYKITIKNAPFFHSFHYGKPPVNVLLHCMLIWTVLNATFRTSVAHSALVVPALSIYM